MSFQGGLESGTSENKTKQSKWKVIKKQWYPGTKNPWDTVLICNYFYGLLQYNTASVEL